MCLLLALVLWPSAGPAQETGFPETPRISVTLAPASALTDGWVVDAQLVVTVRVVSRSPFDALSLDLGETGATERIELLRPRTRQVRSYAGSGTVLETAFALFARDVGRLVIPPMRASGRVTDTEGREIAFTDATDPLGIDVAALPARAAMATRGLTISETWSAPPRDARTGDVLRREVSVTAEGLTSDRVQLPDLGSTLGVPATDAGGTARTERTATGVIAHVTRAWDLEIAGEGVVYVAPLGVRYWDPVAREVRQTGVPGLRLEPLPPDGAAIAARLMAEAEARHRQVWWITLAVAGLCAVPVLGLAALWLWIAVPGRADRRLRRALRRGGTAATLWPAVRAWQAAQGHAPEIVDACAAVSARLFGPSQPEPAVIGRRLLQASRGARADRAQHWLGRCGAWLIGPRVGLAPAAGPSAPRRGPGQPADPHN